MFAPRRAHFKNDEDYQSAVAAYQVRVNLVEMLDKGRHASPVDLDRVFNLRFSGLPFCSVRWFLNLPQKLRSETQADFGSRFFTSVGHTVHDVFQSSVHHYQQFMALNDYVCTNCKKRYVLKANPPKKCSCDSQLFKREEHEVVWNGAIGHVDEIVVPDPSQPKTVFPLDYKTTSLKNLGKKDSIEYLSQLRSYGVALTDAGYKVIGEGLVYVPRDNPFKWVLSQLKFNDQVYAKSKAWLSFWVEEHRKGMSVETPADLADLLASRPCREKVPACYATCPHVEYCGTVNVAHPPEMKRRLKTAYQEIKIWLPLEAQKREHEKQKEKARSS